MTTPDPAFAKGFRPGALDQSGRRSVLRGERQARFVTISREAYAGGVTLAHRLVDHLNRHSPATPWKAFDQELIDKTAQDHHVSGRLIQDLVDSGRGSWLEELFAGMSSRQQEYPNEVKVYHRVARTIRVLAEQGRVVIVGRGGVYITHDMPDGLHVRLVAPRKWRVERAAEALKLGRDKAGEIVEDTDRRRRAFYRKYWYWLGEDIFSPDTFHVTLNVAAMDERQLIAGLTSLILPVTAGEQGRNPKSE